MNKKHWITMTGGGRLDGQLVADLVTESYLLVVEKLPRAQRPVDPATFGQDGASGQDGSSGQDAEDSRGGTEREAPGDRRRP